MTGSWFVDEYILSKGLSFQLVFFLITGFRVSVVEASARSGELEALHGEWEIVVLWVVDEELVVGVLLDALGLVAVGDEWAGLVDGGALFNAGCLGECLILGLDIVDNDSPLAICVDGSQWDIITDFRGTEIDLVVEFLQVLHRVVCVSNHIFV